MTTKNGKLSLRFDVVLGNSTVRNNFFFDCATEQVSALPPAAFPNAASWSHGSWAVRGDKAGDREGRTKW